MISSLEKSDPELSFKNLNLKDFGNYLVNQLNIKEEDEKFEESLMKLEEDVRKRVRKSLAPGKRINYSLDLEGHMKQFGFQ